MRIDIIEIEMQLGDDADIAAALLVDRNQRLDPELKGAGGVDRAGIDGPRGQGA